MKITKYNVVDHGIFHSQYFPGCGVSLSEYSDVVTGCGNNFEEAIMDALDSIAQNGVDNTEDLEKQIQEHYGGHWPVICVLGYWDDHYYYVSIQYSLEEGK